MNLNESVTLRPLFSCVFVCWTSSKHCAAFKRTDLSVRFWILLISTKWTKKTNKQRDDVIENFIRLLKSDGSSETSRLFFSYLSLHAQFITAQRRAWPQISHISPTGNGGANKWPMSPQDLPVREAQRGYRERSLGAAGGGRGRGRRRWDIASVLWRRYVVREDLKWEGKEICVVGGGGGDGGSWVGGGQSNDLAPTTARYPRNVWGRNGTWAEGYEGRLLVSRG